MSTLLDLISANTPQILAFLSSAWEVLANVFMVVVFCACCTAGFVSLREEVGNYIQGCEDDFTLVSRALCLWLTGPLAICLGSAFAFLTAASPLCLLTGLLIIFAGVTFLTMFTVTHFRYCTPKARKRINAAKRNPPQYEANQSE